MGLRDLANLPLVSFDTCDFLNYPELRSVIATTIKNPQKKISLDLGKLEQKEPPDLLVRIKFIFESFVHKVKFYFSIEYRQAFISAVEKVKKVYANKTRRAANRLEMAAIEKEIQNHRTKLGQLEAEIAPFQARMEVQADLEKKVQLNQNTLSKLTADLENLKKEQALLPDFLKSLDHKQKVSTKQKEIVNLNTYLTFFSEQLADAQAQCLKEEAERKIKFAQRATLITTLAHLEDRLNALQAIFQKKKGTPQVGKPQETVETKAVSSSFKDLILFKIEQLLNKEIMSIWLEFFNKFDQALISSWKCDEKGNFTLVVKSPMKLWVPKRAADDPTGGSILILGDRGTVEGQLNAESKTMVFKKGFSIYCKQSFITLTPTVTKFIFQNVNTITMEAGMWGQYQRRSKSLEEYLISWGSLGEPVGEDHAAFLKSKC